MQGRNFVTRLQPPPMTLCKNHIHNSQFNQQIAQVIKKDHSIGKLRFSSVKWHLTKRNKFVKCTFKRFGFDDTVDPRLKSNEVWFGNWQCQLSS